MTIQILLLILSFVILVKGASELVMNVFAAYLGRHDIAVGNIIGSNIFNIFLILGVSSLVNPVVYSSAFDTDILNARHRNSLSVHIFVHRDKR